MTIQVVNSGDSRDTARSKINSNDAELDGRTEGLEGGLAGEIPIKQSSVEGDIAWRNPADEGLKGDPGTDGAGVPTAGTTGQILAKNSNTNYDTEWADSAVPAAGTTGQVLAKNSNTNYDTHWIDAASGGGSSATWDPVRIVDDAGGAQTGTPTRDGVALVVGNRVLSVGGSADTRGIWVVAAGAWSRATDADASGDFLQGKMVYVNEGTEHGGQIWALETSGTVTVGTTSLSFVFAPTYATETRWGLARIATQVEVDAGDSGADIEALVNPFTLAAYPRIASGYTPYAYPIGGALTQGSDTAIALAANGGTIAIPILVVAPMLLQSVSFWNTDAATARGAAEFALFRQNSVTNTLDRVSGAVGSLTSWTPTVASVRTISVTSAPASVYPGIYWLALKNNHASNTLGLGSVAAAAASLSANTTQTKTLTTSAFGTTLDFTAATWTKRTESVIVRLNGRAFGQSSAF